MKHTNEISSIGGALALAACTVLPASAGERTIVDFSEGENLDWRVVNDGVMGGLSQGKIEVSAEGVMTFSGDLSLENNGGFSSIRTGGVEMDLSDAEGFAARVRGDGRTYQMRISTDARYRGMEISFMAEFDTEKGQWTEVRVPFGEFTGSFRGMKLRKAEFDPSKVSRLGLILADKQAGPFKLEVDWIKTYGGASSSGNTVVDAALADGRFGTLATALTEAGLVEALKGEGPFTVFAPTDAAFAKLPQGTVKDLLKPENKEKLQAILKYHVLSGAVDLSTALKAGEADTLEGGRVAIAFKNGRVRVGEAAVQDADITVANGVIHVIDSVLTPPVAESTTDIVGVAKAAGNFKTLLAAAKAAGLVETLRGEGPLTILAPADEAFAKLPKGTVENLLKTENRDQLKAILTYHAIPGTVSAGDALNAGTAKTVNGGKLCFGIKDGRFQVNGATILTAGIEADNGVIHVIDSVLLPGSDEGGSAASDCAPAMTPLALIEDAIERGVPVFNGGDHGGCAEIYRETIKVLSMDERVDEKMRKAMKRLLEHTDGAGSETEKAWLYRRTLDHVHTTISSKRG